MNGLTTEQIAKIKARLDALESIQGILSRVRTLGDKDWRLGCIYNHTAYPLNDDQAEAAWAFVEHAPDDIAALLAHIEALEAEIGALREAILNLGGDPDQAWFWTDRWQQLEREAQEDIDAGRVEDASDFLAE